MERLISYNVFNNFTFMLDRAASLADQFLAWTLSGSLLESLVVVHVIVLCTFIVRRVVTRIFEDKLGHMASKTGTEVDDLLIKSLKDPVNYIILVIGFYLAMHSLPLPENIVGVEVSTILTYLFTLLFTLVALFTVFRLIDVLAHYIEKAATTTETVLDKQLGQMIIKGLKLFAVVLALLTILDNLGRDITSLLAGLGIAGLALALAAQETVSNLFGSFTIFSDRCFGIGDWVRIGDVEGTVEDVGFRSTRIRRFDQALVIVPNSKFIKSDVINYSAMRKRRIKFTLGVSYKTTPKQMREVIEGIKRIIQEDPRFDHSFYMVNFTDFGAYSLDIFIYCFTKTIVWDEYLAVREDFNLMIMRLVEELGVEIAYPTQTVHLIESTERSSVGEENA